MKFVRQNGKLLLLVPAAILCGWLILTLAVPQAAAGPQATTPSDLTWHVVAGGGATMTSDSYTLAGTAGQAVTGEMTGGGKTLISGFWADMRTFVEKLFLPAVRAD